MSCVSSVFSSSSLLSDGSLMLFCGFYLALNYPPPPPSSLSPGGAVVPADREGSDHGDMEEGQRHSGGSFGGSAPETSLQSGRERQTHPRATAQIHTAATRGQCNKGDHRQNKLRSEMSEKLCPGGNHKLEG